MSTRPSMFRTAEGQARYFAAYDRTLALWPVAVESFDVPTCFGSTHVHACGPQDAPPLVLLPGQAISSTMWYPNIGALSQAYRVYVLDIVGDMGKSVSTRKIEKPTDLVEWLKDVLDALHLDQTHVAGLSYGGAIALWLAITAPERVRKLVLMAPASLLALRRRYFLRMAAIFLPDFVLSRASKQKLLLGTYSSTAVPAMEQMLTTTDFRYSMYLPPVCTEQELQRISAPTLLLVGDHEVIYNPQAALKRASAFISDFEAVLIPGAGHALNFDRPELVNTRILEFLKREAV